MGRENVADLPHFVAEEVFKLFCDLNAQEEGKGENKNIFDSGLTTSLLCFHTRMITDLQSNRKAVSFSRLLLEVTEICKFAFVEYGSKDTAASVTSLTEELFGDRRLKLKNDRGNNSYEENILRRSLSRFIFKISDEPIFHNVPPSRYLLFIVLLATKL